MKKNTFSVTAVALVVVAALGSAVYVSNNRNSYNSVLDNTKPPVVQTHFAPVAGGPVDFQEAAEVSVPAVVHIKTVVKFKEASTKQNSRVNPFGDFFGNDDMFKRFFGDGNGNFQIPDQKASGSGVIISKDGYIVTNNHVVDGASEITVTLNDRKNFKAKVVGTDANTDLALIKIDGKDLPVMPIGNSDDTKLGQWVLAIGYPLNLDVTVTQGIISAKSRNIGINRQGNAPVEAFIQTDAAVNPGSSGGALVNTAGELIGINAAIASPTGAYAGYAYAIPSNLMKKVIGDIMKYGSVQRGYLGISMAPENLDNATQKELGINNDINGVWIAETDPQGAAAQAGLKKGDAIIKVNGSAVSSPAELSEQIARMKPGDKVNITYLRDRSEKNVTVTLRGKMGSFPSQDAAAIESLGAQFRALTKEQAAQSHISGGVQVTHINDNGIIASQTNMRDGFIITKIGDTPVKTVDDLKAALNKQENNFQMEGVYPGSTDVYYYGINGFRR
ncbi:MAG TPA: trypsin-like peptidase domain-containing protein [Agriterribacter sp.]|nr:trypsin-like peptidase domain-containing protein [Chitinophagaceae bacterium]HRP32321.1 trypsin-like peptidase domain-containing protein [Agriterribacter sp.]